MSFQVPGGMLITGAMLQFYRTVPAIVFWQVSNVIQPQTQQRLITHVLLCIFSVGQSVV